MFVREYNVSPNMKSSTGYTPLHIAAIYGRVHLYKELIGLYNADPAIADFTGLKSEAYLDTNLGYGANNKGMRKMWQDLALDIQSYQKQCFEEQQKHQRNPKDPKCFEGIKKRHSIGF